MTAHRPVVRRPQAISAALELERFLPYRLSELANRVSQTLATIYRERFGLSIPEWRTLAILGRFAPMSSRDIGERASMDKAKVSRAVAGLIDKGLVRRGADPADGRLIAISLSERGHEMLAAIAPLALAWEAALLDALDEEERQQLGRLIDKLRARVGELAATREV